MKVLGISFGRIGGNDEVLVKEALLGAREAGAEVEFIRFNDYKILPCDGCNACQMRAAKGGKMECIHDDDFGLLEDRIFDADGIIYASPIYIWGPSGGYRNLCDRFGPNHDVVLLRNKGMEGPDATIDQRVFKKRVAAFISVGGTTNDDYATMGLSLMPMMTHSMQTKVVDQMMCLDTDQVGKVFKHPDKIERAHGLGRNVAMSCGVASKELKWYGEEGTCPCCHNNLFTLDNGDDKVTCCLCGIDGKLEMVDGKIKVTFNPEQFQHQRETDEEMASHGREIKAQMEDWFARKDELLPKMQKYRDYKINIVKPAKRS
jgi:multimeric flavodoxin WrbA